MVLLYFLNYFNSLNSGSNIDHTVIGISRKHARDRRKPPTYCDDGTVTLIEKNENKGIQAAFPIRYCAYKNPAISSRRRAALSGYFIFHLFSSDHSQRNSLHVRQKQTSSSEPGLQSMTVGPRRSLRRSFSSLLLGRSILYFLFGALKYVKVGNLNMETGITW